MTSIGKFASCTDCGEPISEDSETLESPQPCPHCGSTKRTFGLSIHEQVTARDGFRMKQKETGGKWHLESRAEPSFSHRLQKHVHREMHVDRKNDRYFEQVTDYETGEVIHHNEEPLSQHVGRGSAKPKVNVPPTAPTSEDSKS